MHGLYFDAKIGDEKRGEGLYQGDLFVYSPTAGKQALCAFARALAEEAFGPYHPTVAQEHMPVEHYMSILAEFKPKFIHHPQSKEQAHAC